MLRRLYTINFIDAFIVGGMTVLVPLLMAARGIDITTIGLVFAAAPLAKAIVRLASAGIADSFGDRVIYIVACIANFLETITYMLSSAAAGFGAGKLLDGARESLVWSTVRPSLMAAAPEKKHFAFTSLLSGRFIYNALGSLAVGALFAFGGFELPLAAMIALSAYILLASLRLKNFHRAKTHARLSDFSPFGRSRKFYEIAGVFTVGSALYGTMFYMLLPLYFAAKGFTLGEIGVFYAGYFMIIGAMLHLMTHRKVSAGVAAFSGAAIYCFGLAGVALAPHALIPLFFLSMAVGDAGLALIWEQVNFIAAKESKKRAIDLSLLVMPSYFGVMLVTGVSGAAVAAWGYMPFFALLALSEIGFAAWCVRLEGMEG